MSDWDRKVCPKCDWGHYGKNDVCDPCSQKQSPEYQLESKVVLTFNSSIQKNIFMLKLAQLENFVTLKNMDSDDFYECREFYVTNKIASFSQNYSSDADEDTN